MLLQKIIENPSFKFNVGQYHHTIYVFQVLLNVLNSLCSVGIFFFIIAITFPILIKYVMWDGRRKSTRPLPLSISLTNH